MPADADEKATPRWEVVGSNGRYEWHDHRIHWMSKDTPPQVKDEDKADEDLRLERADRGRGPARPGRGYAELGAGATPGVPTAALLRARRRSRPPACCCSSVPQDAHTQARRTRERARGDEHRRQSRCSSSASRRWRCCCRPRPRPRTRSSSRPRRPAAITVDRQPRRSRFEFNEPVEGSFGAVRVFDGRGERVDDGDLLRPAGSESVGVRLEGRTCPNGTYTATYRVISADGHPVAGGFVFSIGAPGVPGKTVAELTAACERRRRHRHGVRDRARRHVRGDRARDRLARLPARRLAAGAAHGRRAEEEWLEASRRFARRLRQAAARRAGGGRPGRGGADRAPGSDRGRDHASGRRSTRT